MRVLMLKEYKWYESDNKPTPVGSVVAMLFGLDPKLTKLCVSGISVGYCV